MAWIAAAAGTCALASGHFSDQFRGKYRLGLPLDRRLRHYDRPVPIYEFECGECGERFEALVDAGTEAADCPICGTAGAERRLSTFGLSRQPTPSQQRRMEDKRGTNRDGARTRFKDTLARNRGKKPGP
jgi:putative FmdB family regulatory protein